MLGVNQITSLIEPILICFYITAITSSKYFSLEIPESESHLFYWDSR